MNKQFFNFKKTVGKLALAVTIVGATTVGANAATFKGVTNHAVNLRDDAGKSGEIITTIGKEKSVNILSENGNWYKVEYNGKTGYVYKTYVEKKNYSVEKYDSMLRAKTSVNVRKEATTKSDVVVKLQEGDKIEVTGKVSNGWYEVKYEGKTAYITGLEKYVEECEKYTVEEYKGTLQAKTSVNVRKAPTTKSDSLGKLQADEKVEITGKVSNGWYEVVYKGEKGYVTGLEKYVHEYENQAPVITFTNENVKDNKIEVKEGTTFTVYSLGAKATDAEDGDIAGTKLDYQILEKTDAGEVIVDKVDTTKAGVYVVKVTAKDSEEKATTVEVEVTVKENKAPEISFTNENVKDKKIKVKVGESFIVYSLGAKATDAEDGDIAGTKLDYQILEKTDAGEVIVDKVDTTKEGVYVVKVTAKDSEEKATTVEVEVTVKDNQAPEITFTNTDIKEEYGQKIISVAKNSNFTVYSLGAKATDEEDGDLAGTKLVYKIYEVKGTGTKEVEKIDTTDTGKYLVKVTATDSQGKATTAEVNIYIV